MKKAGMLFAIFIFSAAAVLFFAEGIRAQEEEVENTVEAGPVLDNPRTFALGITTLKEHGFGAKVRMRWDHFALDGSVGSLPWMVMYQTSDGTTTYYDFAMSLHGDLSGVIFFNGDQKRFQNGIRVGGLYDSIGGYGGMLGWTGELTFNTFALCFGAGIQYYPDIVEGLNEKFPDTKDAELESAKTQLYLGINFMWYLF